MLLLTACTSEESAHGHTDTYTCPMHPTVVSDVPGTCPVCGMDLVPKARAGEEVEITEDLARMTNSPNEAIVASMTTIRGQYKSLPVSVGAQGVITYDTRKVYTIPARIGGRLEKVYVKYAFQPVSKGQKIAEIYSPELITAQRELLFLLENDPHNNALIEASKRRLQLLGMSDSQVVELIRRKEPRNALALYSPHSGYVITSGPAPAMSATIPSSGLSSSRGGMADGMGSVASAPLSSVGAPQTNSSGSLVREGDYVTAGQTLFTIVDNGALRIELNAPDVFTGDISVGDHVELDFGNGDTRSSTVDFVQPFFTEGREFLKLRVYSDRTEGLHVGHLVEATLHLGDSEGLWVPRESVLHLGLQKVVFLRHRGVFKPKEVTTGATTRDMIQILSGLASFDEIAENAQFLVDSESFIKTVD